MQTLNDLPVYRLTINEANGVEAVALVDDPAIMVRWQTFNNDKKFGFSVADAEQRVLFGPLMMPDLPIYRSGDASMPEHYVIFDKQTIQQIVLQFFEGKRTSNVNLMHTSAVPDGVFMFQSFITNEAMGILPPPSYSGIAEGTWFGAYKVNNDAVWDEWVKTNKFTGFSVEGVFSYENTPAPAADPDETLISEIKEILAK